MSNHLEQVRTLLHKWNERFSHRILAVVYNPEPIYYVDPAALFITDGVHEYREDSKKIEISKMTYVIFIHSKENRLFDAHSFFGVVLQSSDASFDEVEEVIARHLETSREEPDPAVIAFEMDYYLLVLADALQVGDTALIIEMKENLHELWQLRFEWELL